MEPGVNIMSESASGITNGGTPDPECPAVGVSGSKPLANGESEGTEKEDLSCTAEEGFQTQTTVLEGEEGSQIDTNVSEQTETKVCVIPRSCTSFIDVKSVMCL